MIPAGSLRAPDAPPRPAHVVYCDGGLCNRLNALIYALILRDRFGHEWSIAWPKNNWCGADFQSLFSVDMPVFSNSLQHFTRIQDDYLFLVHEIQGDLRPDRAILHHSLSTHEAYGALLEAGTPVFYYHNLLPHSVDVASVKHALEHLRVVPRIWARARDFCIANDIDDSVIGLHIRKTDFGGAIDDSQLFSAVSVHPGRFFVCSDDREVNDRFAGLVNCRVLKKCHFPEKLLADGDWNSSTTDSEGRRFPFNITRPEDSIVEALADLLILSTTNLAATSTSTFLGMARLFKAASFFSP